MSDIDDDLLALAGVTDSEEESPKRKYDDFEADDEDAGYSPESELVNPYPLEGKYKDEQDRVQLEEMDEITREEILFERSQEMERYNEKKYLTDRMKKGTRSSKRVKNSGKDEKTNKLSELRKQREKKQRSQYSDYEEDEEEEEEDNELDEDDLDLDLGDDYNEDKVVWGRKSNVARNRTYTRAEYKDINRIHVGRSVLLKYCFNPDFENIIIDCYGRINLGVNPTTKQTNYRMVKIIDVEHKPDKKYKVPNFQSDLYLIVSQNKKQTKSFPMNIFSDNKIEESEFQKYLSELAKTNEEIDYVDDVNEKYEQLKNELYEKSLTDHEINEMIENKQKLFKTLNGFNAVVQKAKLIDQLKIAKQQNDLQKIELVTEELKNLDMMLSSSISRDKESNTNSMAKVNERNRKLNLENIKKAELKVSMMKKLNDEDQGGNPFLRLKTVTRVFYQDIINLENEKANKDAKLNLKEMISQKETNEQKIARSSYRVLGVMDDLINDIEFDDIVV